MNLNPNVRSRRARRSVLALLAVAGASGALAAPATAAPADDAGCVAVLTHDPAVGAPGEDQRNLHWDGLGRVVASIARQEKGSCSFPIGGDS